MYNACTIMLQSPLTAKARGLLFYWSYNDAQRNETCSRASNSQIFGDCLVQIPVPTTTDDATTLENLKLALAPRRKRPLATISIPPPPPPQNVWSNLPGEILALIVTSVPDACPFKTVTAVSQVCQRWRQCLGAEKTMWRELPIKKCSFIYSTTVANMIKNKKSGNNSNLPWALKHALQAGNVEATVSVARYMTSIGANVEALRLYQKAARKGKNHPEALQIVGFSSYKGLYGMQQDSEEACINLNRAAKQLLDALEPSFSSSSTNTELPSLMSRQQCGDVLAQCAHVLAYLYLDGEGVQADQSTAIKWLKIAERYGCVEARKMLGSLFRNGQY